MSWKNSFILLCLVSSFSWASVEPEHYKTYQRLQIQLQKDPVEALTAIKLFTKQVQSADDQSKQMAAYLQLQACIALNRYGCAAESVESLLDLNQDSSRHADLLKLSAQLHYQTQSYKNVVVRVRQWLVENESADKAYSNKDQAEMYALQGYSFYYLSSYASAVEAIEQSIHFERTEQRQVFVLGLYQQNKDWQNVNRVLQDLVSDYAQKSEYWEKYAYSFLKLGQEEQALKALGSAYKSARLPKRSVILYAQMLLRFNAPDRAAKVLEAHPDLESHIIYQRLLTQSYLLARDKKKAEFWLSKSDNKEAYATRALLAYQQGEWLKAISLFEHLDPNNKSNHYWLLLSAISEFELRRWDNAKQAFARLKGTNYDQLAEQWLSQIDYLLSD
ncbi:hypothetical protein ABXV17_17385 [Vibrio harveyi]|uniref:tetratricopeptide repeat protein n=1 Tax=Vibrio harveyi TaxID=669 RepID=UPI0033936C89